MTLLIFEVTLNCKEELSIVLVRNIGLENMLASVAHVNKMNDRQKFVWN